MATHRKEKGTTHWNAIGFFLFMIGLPVFLTACAEIQKPEPVPFYAETAPPRKQEFRWSNGRTPKSFDPARAAAAPETDIVCALFKGLTDIDPRTLKEIPSVAERWTSSPDGRVWTFQLRKDAHWSNGKKVVAADFVASWNRLATLGEKAAHRELFQNIIGLQTQKVVPLTNDNVDFVNSPLFGEEVRQNDASNSTSTVRMPGVTQEILPSNSTSHLKTEHKAPAKPAREKLGVEAIDETTLQVTLEMPDKDFPKLVANPIFRPIYGDGNKFDTAPLDADIVTNGAFTVASVGKDGIVLDRSDSYWNKSAVRLEGARFVSNESGEAALSAYRKGEIDAVTNAEFEPLALKILSPYDDFRQTTYSALNFYEFNTKNPPFNARMVREALAISIDRERITNGELERSAWPATSFLPLGDKKNARLSFDVQKAKKLLGDAGFEDGVNFPKIRLLINRNDIQQRVARAVSRMWKQNLNLDTEIIVKELSEINRARASGEYDLIRRGVVLPTLDEAVSMATIFAAEGKAETLSPDNSKLTDNGEQVPSIPSVLATVGHGDVEMEDHPELVPVGIEEEAMLELKAIPLYFPMAYSLVKPYVRGFEVNGLGATSLEEISIDSNWELKN